MPTHCIVDAEKDADMKSLSKEEAIAILSDMKIDIPVPKAAVTQRKRNVALDMAISALNILRELPEVESELTCEGCKYNIDKIKWVWCSWCMGCLRQKTKLKDCWTAKETQNDL